MRNLKKVISSVAALAMVASSSSALAAAGFTDVDASASYVTAVQALKGLGIVEGDENGLFNPDNQVTRAEFTKMAVGALGEGSAAEAQTSSQFTDASNTTVHWAAGYIAQGVSDGFINGYDDTTFGPNDKVTYAQACKMLVAAIGYTTYAENAGGYPSGYVAQANSLGVTSGVSVTNDTELTRAQCATLIYNAMDVPLCTIDSWDNTINYLTGETVQTPVLKKLDGKENRDFQNLFTDRHDAYKVRGRVSEVAQGASSLESDEVTYKVEVADNLFDDEINFRATDATNVREETVKIGDTNASSTLLEYTEALIQYDDAADEYTMIALTQFGSSKRVEAPSSDVDDLTTDGGETVLTGSSPKLAIAKSSTSSSTTKYDLSVNAAGTGTDAVLYVNNVEVGVIDETSLEKYLINNKKGTVTLIDETTVGSTSTDGKYEYIMVDYYLDLVVDSVSAGSSAVRIYGKGGDISQLKYDPENSDLDLTITKDGAKIDVTDLVENDVLSIAYDVTQTTSTSSISDLDYYNIVVSSNSVTGNVTNHVDDGDDNTVTIDGQEYEFAVGSAMDLDLNTDYTLYIDSFGYVAYYDEGNSEKNYGVIVAMYLSAGNDNYTVRMITSDAQVVAYECKEAAEATKFYNYAVNGDETKTDSVTAFTKNDIKTQITNGDTVCQYTLSSGKVKFKQAETANGGTGLEYKASSQKVGSYSINESVTKMIDMDGYMNGGDTTVGTLSLSSFTDEATYDAYFFGRNSNSDYRFAIIFGGMSSLRADASLAVVQKVNGTSDLEGVTCTSVNVSTANTDSTTIYLEDGISVAEGDVISYVVGSDGYVEDESAKFAKVFTLNGISSYETLLATAVTGNTSLYPGTSDMFPDLSSTVDSSSLSKDGAYRTPDYDTSSSKDVKYYFGPVYKKSGNSLELFTYEDPDGMYSVNNTYSFAVGGSAVNAYVYDYNYNTKYRVYTGSINQTSSIYVTPVYTDANKTLIDSSLWDANGVTPAFAFVRTVDDDVTDVLYFLAD